MFAILASTYGWAHDDILNLTIGQFVRYLSEVSKIEARSQIRTMETSSYPHMETKDRKKIDRYYHRILQPFKQSDVDSAWNNLKSIKDVNRAGTRTG